MDWIRASKGIYSAYLQTPEDKFQADKRIFESLPNVTVRRPWYSERLLRKCEEQNGGYGFPMPVLTDDMQLYFLMTHPNAPEADNNLDGSSDQNMNDPNEIFSSHDARTTVPGTYPVAAQDLISSRCCWLHAATNASPTDDHQHHHRRHTARCPSTVLKRTPLESMFPNGFTGPMRKGPEREFTFRDPRWLARYPQIPQATDTVTGTAAEVDVETEAKIEVVVVGFSDRRRASGKYVPRRLQLVEEAHGRKEIMTVRETDIHP